MHQLSQTRARRATLTIPKPLAIKNREITPPIGHPNRNLRVPAPYPQQHGCKVIPRHAPMKGWNTRSLVRKWAAADKSWRKPSRIVVGGKRVSLKKAVTAPLALRVENCQAGQADKPKFIRRFTGLPALPMVAQRAVSAKEARRKNVSSNANLRQRSGAMEGHCSSPVERARAMRRSGLRSG